MYRIFRPFFPYVAPNRLCPALTNVLMGAPFKVVLRLECPRREKAYNSPSIVAIRPCVYLGSRYFNITKLEINGSERIHIDSLDKFIHHLAVPYLLD